MTSKVVEVDKERQTLKDYTLYIVPLHHTSTHHLRVGYITESYDKQTLVKF